VKNLAIARRYARALLLIGKEDGQAEAYRSELIQISDMIVREKKLEQAICNPLYDAAGRKRVLATVIEKLNFSKVMQTFLLLLFDKGRIGFLGSINDRYQDLADELKGIARANVVSATALSEENAEKIRATLSQMTGKNIVLEIEQDPGLIGGIVTRVGDLVLDGSIRTQLMNMKETLKKGERA
jgi:F-type H+-transporting ATPase subunit delta